MCFPSYNSSIQPMQYIPLSCELFREHTILTFSFIKKCLITNYFISHLFLNIFQRETRNSTHIPAEQEQKQQQSQQEQGKEQ